MRRHYKKYVLIWFAVLTVLLMATGTYAAYTSVKYAKSVAVARKEVNDIRFSSNYLDLRGKGDAAQLKLLTASGSPASVAITVCNYTQNEPDKPHATAISYTMNIKILDINGNELGDSITYQAQNGSIKTISKIDLLANLKVNGTQLPATEYTISEQLLSGGVSDQNIYTLTCVNPEVLSEISILMTATPSSCSDCEMGNKVLTARLKILVSSAQTGWTGHITDEPKVDAFNYEMSGTTETTVTLSWDTSKVEIGYWSLQELKDCCIINNDNQDIINVNGNSIDLNVGGAGKPASYQLQFYRTSAIPENEDNDDLNSYVTLTTPSQNGE